MFDCYVIGMTGDWHPHDSMNEGTWDHNLPLWY